MHKTKVRITALLTAFMLLFTALGAGAYSAEYYTILNFDCMRTVNPENTHRDYGTISYIKNGVEMLNHGIREETAREQAGESLHNIYAKDYYAPFSTNYYCIKNDDVILKTNGFWNPVKAKVRYINYTEQPQAEPRQQWIDHFQSVLEAECGKTDSPVIISEAWITWWNGVEYAAVNATNCIKTDAERFQNYENNSSDNLLPAGKNHIMYEKSAFFINNKAEKDFVHGEVWNVESIPIDDIAGLAATFVQPAEDEWVCRYYFSLQHDENGKVVAFPVYDRIAHLYEDFNYKPTFFFGDADGDGKLEMVEYERGENSAMFGGYSIYDLDGTTVIHSDYTNDGM